MGIQYAAIINSVFNICDVLLTSVLPPAVCVCAFCDARLHFIDVSLIREPPTGHPLLPPLTVSALVG